ncbi:hypothetical protein BX666DRAFT_1416767 [Dichotomocladium elegans]|nr:hypothetical protein BX666DRAFT_1416767 [Dichotomocladium elegans]
MYYAIPNRGERSSQTIHSYKTLARIQSFRPPLLRQLSDVMQAIHVCATYPNETSQQRRSVITFYFYYYQSSQKERREKDRASVCV